MFRKLVKYEWTATMRAMTPVYAAVLLLSIMNAVMSAVCYRMDLGILKILPFLPYIQTMVVFLYIAVLIGMGVYAAVVVIQRFYKGLLKQEGYLMFTLPVKTWELVLSKACIALLMGVVSMLVAGLSVGILGGTEFLKALLLFPGEFFKLMRQALETDSAAVGLLTVYAVEFAVLALICLFTSLYRLYAAMALGQLCENHKVLFSVLWYVGLDVVIRIGGFVFLALLTDHMGWLSGMEPQNVLHVVMVGGIAIYLVLLSAFWGVTNYILEKRLNLE